MLRFTTLGSLALMLVTFAVGCGSNASPGNDDSGTLPGTDAGHDAALPASDAGHDAASVVDSGIDAASPGDDAAVDDDAAIPDAGDLPDVMIADVGPSCAVGQSYCGTSCIDVTSDRDNCAFCGHSCMTANVTGSSCVASHCQISACTPGYADLDHDVANGCEVMQDFGISLESSAITLGAGGSAIVIVDIDRINGFPYVISLNANGLPSDGTITTPGVALSPDSTIPLRFNASPTALPGPITVNVRATATVGTATVTHSVPLSIDVTSSPITITSVTARDATGALPSHQARQGQGVVTLHVVGTGLSSATSAMLEELTATAVAGGTDTARDYTVTIDPAVRVAIPVRPMTLTLNSAGGGATFADALSVTPITTSTTGSDTARGSFADPFQTYTHAASVAGAGSRVLLLPGLYEADESWTQQLAPGVLSVQSYVTTGPVATLRCSDSPTGVAGVAIFAQSDLQLGALTIENCMYAIASNAVITVSASDLVLHDGDGGVGLAAGSTLVWTRGAITGAAPIAFSGGLLHLHSVDSSRGIAGVNTTIELEGVYFHETAGTAVQIGGSTASYLTSGEFAAITGTALDLVGGTSMIVTDLFTTQVGTAIHLGSSSVTLEGALALSRTNGSAVIDIDGTGSTLLVDAGATTPWIFGSSHTGIRAHPSAGGTATLHLGALTLANGEAGVVVENPDASAHVTIDATSLVLTQNDIGVRIDGGITDLTASELRADQSSGMLVDLISGTGTLAIESGAIAVGGGSGVVAEASSGHAVRIGATDGTRSVTLDVAGHPYDFHFAVEDHRISTSTIAPLSVRAVFHGVDGAPRTWSGVIHGITGSYSSSVSPRDLASWFVGRSEAAIDFGAP